jgi:hypothetical protein
MRIRIPSTDFNRRRGSAGISICVSLGTGEERGRLERVWADCSSADPAVYQLVLSWEDGSLMSLTPRGNTMFTREEGLASIHTAQMVVRAVQEDSQAGANRAEFSSIFFASVLSIIVYSVPYPGSGVF